MANIETLNAQLIIARNNLKEKQAEMESYEISRSDEDYMEYLDEVYGTVEIAGGTYNTGYALQQLDPTAFRGGLNDWTDSLDKEDEEDYKGLMEEEEELENEISDLEEKIEELENEEEDEEN
ncbi:hypothetical protein [Acinetobacter phage ABPH49]|nr:hypothetical protein [Acinetobacter phage ABPH49]